MGMNLLVTVRSAAHLSRFFPPTYNLENILAPARHQFSWPSGSGLFAKRRHCIMVKLFGNEEARMNQQEFAASLKEDGYTQIEAKSLRPRPRNDEHGHPFAVRGLVLAGAFTVTQCNITRTYRTGEIFSVAAGQDHSEEVGPDGAEVVVGRKY
jgi:quercetin dioxygenase-like cupin family protein